MLTILNTPILLPMASGIALACVLSWLGVFVVMKKMSFVADGIAHASLAGVALGLLVHADPLYTALGFSLLVGIVIYVLERKTNLPVDAIITLLFTSSLAVGALLMRRSGEPLDALEDVLFGDITRVGVSDMILMFGLAVLVGVFLWRFCRRLALVVFDRATAQVSGINVNGLEFFFYLVLVITIVLGIKIFGVLLVTALMVIPASAAKLVGRSFHGAVAMAILFSTLIMLAGLPLAYVFDLPTGPIIVLTGAILFTFMMGVHRFAYARKT